MTINADALVSDIQAQVDETFTDASDFASSVTPGLMSLLAVAALLGWLIRFFRH